MFEKAFFEGFVWGAEENQNKRNWLPFGHLSLYSLIRTPKIDGRLHSSRNNQTKKQIEQMYLTLLPFFVWLMAVGQSAYRGRDAERRGFEPLKHFWRLLTFQASQFNHSCTSPFRVTKVNLFSGKTNTRSPRRVAPNQ